MVVVLPRWFHWYTTGTNDALKCELTLKAFYNFCEITLKSLVNLKAGFEALKKGQFSLSEQTRHCKYWWGFNVLAIVIAGYKFLTAVLSS